MVRARRDDYYIGTKATPKRVAVLLNANAKRVTNRVLKKIKGLLSQGDVYYTRTLEEAEKACHEIYQKGYDAIFTGGGDGTLMNCLTTLREAHYASGGAHQIPPVGVLFLGTGNAVASLLKASRNYAEDINLVGKEGVMGIRYQRWVEVNGLSAPFAGFGYDSLILNNYRKLKKTFEKTPFAFLGTGGIGYFIAIAFLSIPQALVMKKPHVKVINTGGKAVLLDKDGGAKKVFSEGETLFEGEASIVSLGTVPYFGFNFCMYPFARDGQKMQLRITNASPIEALLHLPSVWKGTYRSPNIYDFHVESVHVEYTEPQPLQIGGDAAGYFKEMDFTISKSATPLIDFTPVRAFKPKGEPKKLKGMVNGE